MKRILCFALLALAGFAVGAQEMNSLQFRARVSSPEVTADAITFRFAAPKARTVGVSASWMGYRSEPMVQGPDGIWTFKAPLPAPEL